MQYKLLERFRGRFAVEPEFVEPTLLPMPAPVLDVQVKPRTRSMHRFDIEVEGSHNYLADGVIVHNSPETTTGGKALKFYASVRLDIRRIETLKDGSDMVGNRTRVKVVKNKVAPPFKQAEFDILYGVGISREGSLIDVGVEQGIVRKSGAWYTYEGDQLGQGKENARKFLRENPDVAAEIEKRIKEKLGHRCPLDAESSRCRPRSTSETGGTAAARRQRRGRRRAPGPVHPPGPVRVARLDALPTAADGAGTRPVARFDAIGPGRGAGAGTGENATRGSSGSTNSGRPDGGARRVRRRDAPVLAGSGAAAPTTRRPEPRASASRPTRPERRASPGPRVPRPAGEPTRSDVPAGTEVPSPAGVSRRTATRRHERHR